MTLLKKWDDIDKEKIQRGLLGQRLTEGQISVLRAFENIFEGGNSHVQAHQCHKCGGIFIIGDEKLDTLKKEDDQLICQMCAEQPDENNEKNLRYIRLAEATANIQFWEKSSKKSKEEFELLKQRLTGIIQFDTPREMYVKYHKLSKQSRDDYPGMGSRLTPENQKMISDAFDKVKTENFEEFVKMVWGVNQVEEKEVQEMINMIEGAISRVELEYWLPKIMPHTTFSMNVKTKEELDRNRIKYQLLIYGQLVEFGFIYDLLYNLTRIKNGEKWIEIPFPPDDNGNPIFPHSKILAIEKEDEEIGKLLKGYFVNVLRNAIAHAKYRVDDKFVYKTDKKNWKMSRTQVRDKVTSAKAVFRALLNRIADEQAEMMEQKRKMVGNDEFTFQMDEDRMTNGIQS